MGTNNKEKRIIGIVNKEDAKKLERNILHGTYITSPIIEICFAVL